MDNEVLERIIDKINTLFDSRVAGQPYLLSKLGLDLGSDLHTIKRDFDPSLARFVDRFLGDRYEIVLAGPHHNVQAIVLSTVSSNHSPTSFEADATAEEQPVSKKTTSPRFNYRFWAAFAVPLTKGRRYLNIDSLVFEDGDEKPEVGSFIEIEPTCVPGETIANRDIAIHRSIESWLKKHSLRAEQFYARLKGPTPTSRSSRSVLDAIVDALDHKQLSTTQMSLDVVATLLRRQI